MKKAILSSLKALLLCGGMSIYMMGAGQQSVIANKDNTRPDMDRIHGSPNTVTTFAANSFNGYNEVNWTVFTPEHTQQYVLEYSINGVDYQTAASVIPAGTNYSIKHITPSSVPMMYRVKSIVTNGQHFYSQPFMLEGKALSPVTVFPTVITGNMININAAWPVERIDVFSSDGTLIIGKNLNGQRDFIPMAVPSLSAGMYWVAFYGNGWKTTEKIVVP